MRSVLGCVAIGAMVALAGCQTTPDPNKPLDQSKIISVKPAVPDGARKFVEQQQRIEQERQKRSKTQAAQPAGYTYVEKPPTAAGGHWTDIFNPAKWGKGRQDPPAEKPSPKQE